LDDLDDGHTEHVQVVEDAGQRRLIVQVTVQNGLRRLRRPDHR
jgi:hypothetical protein